MNQRLLLLSMYSQVYPKMRLVLKGWLGRAGVIQVYPKMRLVLKEWLGRAGVIQGAVGDRMRLVATG